MTRSEAKNDRESGGNSCCGWEMKGFNSRAGRCVGLLGRHRLAAFVALLAAGLGFLVLQVGWVLGIIAFFRTI